MLKLIHQKAQAKFPNRKDLKIYIIIHVYILTAYAECVNQPSMRHCSLLNILKKPKTIFTICQYSDQDSRPIGRDPDESRIFPMISEQHRSIFQRKTNVQTHAHDTSAPQSRYAAVETHRNGETIRNEPQ